MLFFHIFILIFSCFIHQLFHVSEPKLLLLEKDEPPDHASLPKWSVDEDVVEPFHVSLPKPSSNAPEGGTMGDPSKPFSTLKATTVTLGGS